MKIEDITEELDGLIRQELEAGERLVVYGAGEMGKQFISRTSLDIASHIFDSDSQKWGGFLNGKQVLSPAELKVLTGKEEPILIASRYDDEIAGELEKWGFNRWISLPFLMKEIRIEKEVRERYIKVCMIEATNMCNARCTFCVNPVMKRKKMHMTEDAFGKLLERLREEKIAPEVFRLHCSGEPLMDPALFSKIERLKREFPASRVGYTTNFSLATPENAEKILESGQDYITISLNSIDAEEYEKIMGLKFEKTLRNIEYLIRRRAELHSDLEITLSAVAAKDNEDAIRRFCETWEKEDIHTRVLREGKWISGHGGTENPSSRSRRPTSSCELCTWLYQEICILSDGTYALCCFDAEGSLGKRSVFDTSIEEILNAGVRKQLRQQAYAGGGRLKLCEDCSFNQV